MLPREARTATFAFLLLAPPIFQSLAGYGHIEQPLEVWLLLLSLRLLAKSSFMSAGLLLGLAALTRSTAALFAIPMIVFALPRTPVAAFRLATAMLATGLLVLLPFFLADFSSTASSLFTHRSTLPIYTGSIWVLFRSSPLASLGQHFDFLFICSLALALNLLVATRPGGLTPLRLIAALALTSASFLLLTKTLWPYYFFELFVLTTVFSFSSPGPLLHSRLPPLYACVLGLLAEVGSTPFQRDSIISLEGAAMFVLLLAFIAWLVHAAIHAEAGGEVSTEPEQGRRSAPPRVSTIERLLLPRLRRPV